MTLFTLVVGLLLAAGIWELLIKLPINYLLFLYSKRKNEQILNSFRDKLNDNYYNSDQYFQTKKPDLH